MAVPLVKNETGDAVRQDLLVGVILNHEGFDIEELVENHRAILNDLTLSNCVQLPLNPLFKVRLQEVIIENPNNLIPNQIPLAAVLVGILREVRRLKNAKNLIIAWRRFIARVLIISVPRVIALNINVDMDKV